MKHALNEPSATSLAAQPVNGLTAGLDWAKDDHVVCVMDADGAVVDRFTVEHTTSGLRGLVRGWSSAAAPRSRSSAPTGRSSTRCSRRS